MNCDEQASEAVRRALDRFHRCDAKMKRIRELEKEIKELKEWRTEVKAWLEEAWETRHEWDWGKWRERKEGD